MNDISSQQPCPVFFPPSLNPSTQTTPPSRPEPQTKNHFSLHYLLHFILNSPLPNPDQTHEASILYNLILESCRTAGVALVANSSIGTQATLDLLGSDSLPNATESREHVYIHKFFRALHDYSPSSSGRINLIRLILYALFSEANIEFCTLEYILRRARLWSSFTAAERESVYNTLAVAANDLLIGFFLPLKAHGATTPATAPSTVFIAGVAVNLMEGPLSPLQNLEKIIMERDGHRCVVTGIYDREYLYRHPTVEAEYGVCNRAAHIIPRALNPVSIDGSRLNLSNSFVWCVLNMFDPGISAQVAGTNIDAPENALLIARDLHFHLGMLDCYFHEIEPDTYEFRTVDTTLAPHLRPKSSTLTFVNCEPESKGERANLPSPRLLRIHAACCRMLEMSAAAFYLLCLRTDAKDLRDCGTLATDGSSDITGFLNIAFAGGVMA